MATAKKLNEAYDGYAGDPSEDSLKVLLETVRTHTKDKLYEQPEAEDLAQDVTIKVWQVVDRTCKHPLPPLAGTSSFSTWLSAVIQNHLSNWLLRDSEKYESVGSSYDLTQFADKLK